MMRKLGELQGEDPLVLTLARNNYCPKEHQQHLEPTANYTKIAVAYTQVATISTDDRHFTEELRASVCAQWTFLSDPGREIWTKIWTSEALMLPLLQTSDVCLFNSHPMAACRSAALTARGLGRGDLCASGRH